MMSKWKSTEVTGAAMTERLRSPSPSAPGSAGGVAEEPGGAVQFQKVGEVVRVVAGELGDPAEPVTDGVGVHAQGLGGGGDVEVVVDPGLQGLPELGVGEGFAQGGRDELVGVVTAGSGELVE